MGEILFEITTHVIHYVLTPPGKNLTVWIREQYEVTFTFQFKSMKLQIQIKFAKKLDTIYVLRPCLDVFH